MVSILAGHPMTQSSARPAVIILVVLVLSAGCVHGKIETDLFAAKISSDGKLAWVKVVDSGQNDVGLNLTETAEGGYLIHGGYYDSSCGNSPPKSIPQYQIRLSSTGNIDSIVNNSATTIPYDYRSESYNITGEFSLTTDDGSRLSTYQNVKGSALYLRLQNTDSKGKILWDMPFLTLKYRTPPKDIWETVYIHGIVPTSDNGYIVWGHRERSITC